VVKDFTLGVSLQLDLGLIQSSYSAGYGDVFSGDKSGRRQKLIIHLHLLPRLRMSEDLFPLP